MPYISSIERRAEARGRQEGLEKGRLNALSSLLEYRFGPLPAWAREQLSKATTTLLDSWTPRVLDAPKLEDVFR